MPGARRRARAEQAVSMDMLAPREIVEVGDPVGEHGRVVSGERGRRHRLGTARLNVVVILGVATDEHRRVGARPRELFYG